ncbi:GNAT family N-acetyltransferase, cg3035/Rv0428c family [Prauserella halophila]|uniref:GNAT family N-acetyltransferase, cg3035/Rv0428c family n=1 Tax=Prauserella halophila TaxID=185641 RepID=UPI003CD08657
MRIEHACADAWPAVVDEQLGEWRLRAAGDFTGRANGAPPANEGVAGGGSALAVGDPGRELPAALTAVCDFSHHHAIPPMLQTVQHGPRRNARGGAGSCRRRPAVRRPARRAPGVP